MLTLIIAVAAAAKITSAANRLAFPLDAVNCLEIAWQSGRGAGQRRQGADLWVFSVGTPPGIRIGTTAQGN